MKEKNINIKISNMSQKQWGIFLLELNLMKKAWRPYGIDVKISAPGFKKAINWGTKTYVEHAQDRRNRNRVQQNQGSKI